jgi:hypothetical protein
MQESVEYLEHIISNESVRTDPAKIQVVAEWPIPHSIYEIQLFLGFANFYHRFIKKFSDVTASLTSIVAKKLFE